MTQRPQRDRSDRLTQNHVHWKKRIGDMQAGDRGYALPWAMQVDSQNRCSLNPSYEIYSGPRPTWTSDGARSNVILPIKRCHDGFHVWLPEPRDASWEPFGSGLPDYLPVARLHKTGRKQRLWRR